MKKTLILAVALCLLPMVDAQAARVAASPAELAEAPRWAAAKFEGVQPAAATDPALVVLANHGPVRKNARGDRPMHIVDKEYSRGLYCYGLDGKPLRNQDLGRMRMVMGFGEGSSPALYQDTLIVNRDNEDDSCIIAPDKNNGKTLWKKPREEGTSWSTPLIIERDDKA